MGNPFLNKAMGTWNQPEDKLKQALENLQQTILEVKRAIEVTGHQLSTLESQYSQVMKEAKSWKNLKGISQNQGFDVSTQTAEKQFQEVRQQAILLKTRIKEKEKRLVLLRDAWNQASARLICIQVANFEPSLGDAELVIDTAEPNQNDSGSPMRSQAS